MARPFWILLSLAVLIQFIRPDITPPAVNASHTIQASMQLPPYIDSTIRRACYDCHSSETRWPWYAQIAPMSWWLKSHVNEGRQALSFSEFGTYSRRKQLRKLREACKQVRSGEMPLRSYLPMHPAARLTDADRQSFCSWVDSLPAR